MAPSGSTAALATPLGRRRRNRAAGGVGAGGGDDNPAILGPLLRSPLGGLGLACVALVVGAALFSPWLVPFDPIAIAPHQRLLGPSLHHLLGTDELGRDVLSRVLAGSTTVMSLVATSLTGALVLGIAGGLVAGYGPRLLGGAVILLCDVVLTLPMMLCALALATVLGSGLGTVGLVVTLFMAPAYARIARAQSLALIRLDYVTSARALGAGATRVMLRHLLPNMLGQLTIQAAMDVPTVIGTEVGLTFLGQGAEPPTPSWGSIISDGFSYVQLAPHIVLAGSLPIVIATLGFTFLAEAGARPSRSEARGPGFVSGEDGLLVELDRLSVAYRTPHGPSVALHDVSLRVRRGEVVGLVGESGSGKSTLAHALMALLPRHAILGGRLVFEGEDLLRLDEGALRALRGDRIAAVFQDPFTALNPVMRIGRQLEEFQHRRHMLGRRAKRTRARDMLARVGINDPERRLAQYPLELSGGLRQRIAIAAALLAEPTLLVADEPTTALDATTSAQVVALLRESRAMVRGAIVIVTHDLQVVAELCDRVAVLYAGELVEEGPTRRVLDAPRHPYTKALLACELDRLPEAAAAAAGRGRAPFAFPSIAGQLPQPLAARRGCIFAPRCACAEPACQTRDPTVVADGGGGHARCLRLAVPAASAA